MTSIVSSLLCVLAVASTAAVGDEVSCPQGPFETDRDRIAAAMTSMPVTSPSQEQTSTAPEMWTLTDGFEWEGGGGLQAPREDGLPYGSYVQESYDAKRYIARYVIHDWVLHPGRHEVDRYSTTLVRPTPEQAREIACLGNQLLQPASERETPPPPPAKAKSPKEVVVTGSRGPRCAAPNFTDGHVESHRLFTSATGLAYGAGLSCVAIGVLEQRLNAAVYAPMSAKILWTQPLDAPRARPPNDQIDLPFPGLK